MKHIKQMAEGILADLNNRRGFRQAWDACDEDIQEEIREAIGKAAFSAIESKIQGLVEGLRVIESGGTGSNIEVAQSVARKALESIKEWKLCQT